MKLYKQKSDRRQINEFLFSVFCAFEKRKWLVVWLKLEDAWKIFSIKLNHLQKSTDWSRFDAWWVILSEEVLFLKRFIHGIFESKVKMTYSNTVCFSCSVRILSSEKRIVLNGTCCFWLSFILSNIPVQTSKSSTSN